MSSHSGANGYHQAFPAATDEPTYLIVDSLLNGHSFALGLDSLSRFQIYPPNADYLRRLAAKATALAERMDELAALTEGRRRA